MRLPRLSLAKCIAFGFVVDFAWVEPASAHVKWFCAYDVAEQPDRLKQVLCPNFGLLLGVSLIALFAGAILEGTPVGDAMISALDQATRYVRDNLETIFRAAVGFFFISVWASVASS